MSVTAAAGFVANGVACGIKPAGAPDLALVATAGGPVAAAGVFTTNLATAAPVQVSRSHLAATGGRARAVVLNSGNANAATGAAGRADSERTCALVAGRLGARPQEVLVCSTGLIGIPLPMAPIEAGIPALVAGLSGGDGGTRAADAILTTDTRRKEVVVRGEGWTVGGMAKGAAMLAPHMATMLAVLTTDADVAPGPLTEALSAAVAATFNTVTVDGATSTNDTVLVLASGRAGPPDAAAFAAALTEACAGLTLQMAGDAEGATKLARVRVAGARSDAEAAVAARKVAESQLVKCSLYGCDPYWGRVVSELGSAGVAFDPDKVEVAYGGVTVCRDGVAATHDEAAVVAHLSGREILLSARLGLGDGRAEIVTADLTHAYIDENRATS
ncbi:MAG: bifunctional glutamate N-acetyltransferase/amino-acid acetyltransferase ArgJ [Actinomycetota bacterium]